MFVNGNEIVCGKCGSKDIQRKYDGEYFCRECGYEVPQCKKCGGYNISYGYDDNLFCRDCGAKGDELKGKADSEIVDTISKALEEAVETPKKSKKKLIIIIAAAVATLLLIIGLLAIYSSGSIINRSPVGEWKLGAVYYTFNSDGTCSYGTGVAGIGVGFDGTYTTDGNKLSLELTSFGASTEQEFEYKVKGLFDKTLILYTPGTNIGVEYKEAGSKDDIDIGDANDIVDGIYDAANGLVNGITGGTDQGGNTVAGGNGTQASGGNGGNAQGGQNGQNGQGSSSSADAGNTYNYYYNSDPTGAPQYDANGNEIEYGQVTEPLYQVKTLKKINVRTGPGKNYAIIRTTGKGEKYTIFEERYDGSLYWYRVSASEWMADDGTWLEFTDYYQDAIGGA